MTKTSRRFKREALKGDESHQLWSRRIRSAIKWRMKHKYGDRRWRQNLRLVNFDHWSALAQSAVGFDPTSDMPNDRITVNLTLSTVQDFVAFLLNHDPRFICKPRRQDAIDAAKVKGSLLNYWWREAKMQRQIKRVVWDAVSVGHGILKTGFVTEIDLDRVKDRELDGVINYDEVVRNEAPFVRRVNPFNFVIDPDARDQDLETARWVAEVFFMPLQDVVANERFDKNVRAGIRAGTVTPVTRESWLADQLSIAQDEKIFQDDPVKAASPVVLYEVWDKKFGLYRIYADGVLEPLYEGAWLYDYLDGFPYLKLDFLAINDQMYGVGLPHLMEDQQLELNRIRSAEFTHRRNFGKRLYQVLKGGMEEDEKTKTVNGPDGTMVEVNVPGAIQPIESPQLSSEMYQQEAIIKEDIRQLTGSDKLMEGASLPSRTSATEVRARANMLGMKIEDRVAEVDNFIQATASQVLQHLEANMTQSQVMAIEGADGVGWIQITPEEVKKETSIELISTVAERQDPQMRRQQLLTLYQITLSSLPALQQVGARVNINELFRLVVESFDDKEALRFLGPPLPPPAAPAPAGGPDAATGAPVDPMQQQINAGAAPPESAAMGAALGMLGGGAG